MKKYTTNEVLKFMLKHNLDLRKFSKICDIDEDRVRLYLFNGFNLKSEEKATIDTAIRIIESEGLVNKDEFEDDTWTWEDEQLFIRSVHADVMKERRACEDAAAEIFVVVMPPKDIAWKDVNYFADLAGEINQRYSRENAEKRIRKEVQRLMDIFY